MYHYTTEPTNITCSVKGTRLEGEKTLPKISNVYQIFCNKLHSALAHDGGMLLTLPGPRAVIGRVSAAHMELKTYYMSFMICVQFVGSSEV